MPLIRHKDKLVFFVHIPKTGGTSIEKALEDAGAKSALLYDSRLGGYSKTTFQHMNADIYEKIVPREFYDYGFAVVRHPITRLVSEYFYRVQRGLVNDVFDRWVNIAIDRYAKNPYMIDNHMRPQIDFIRPQIEIFRYENGLEAPLQAAMRHLNLVQPASVPHENMGTGKGKVHWSAATRERAEAFYKDDFDFFEYKPDEVKIDLL